MRLRYHPEPLPRPEKVEGLLGGEGHEPELAHGGGEGGLADGEHPGPRPHDLRRGAERNADDFPRLDIGLRDGRDGPEPEDQVGLTMQWRTRGRRVGAKRRICGPSRRGARLLGGVTLALLTGCGATEPTPIPGFSVSPHDVELTVGQVFTAVYLTTPLAQATRLAVIPRDPGVAGPYNTTGIVGRAPGATYMVYRITTYDGAAAASDSVHVSVAP